MKKEDNARDRDFAKTNTRNKIVWRSRNSIKYPIINNTERKERKEKTHEVV